MIRKIYLAGAMQTYGVNSNEAKGWRDEVKKFFSKYSLGFECISPVDFYAYGEHNYQRDCEVMRFDLRKVKEADVILVRLDDIRKSLGTSDEILYAYLLGKPIIGFIEADEIKRSIIGNIVDYVHPWKYEQIDRIEVGENALINACEYIKNYYF